MFGESIMNKKKLIHNPEDYQKDGLWYCGKCKSAKQMIVFGKVQNIVCECEAAKIKSFEAYSDYLQKIKKDRLEIMQGYKNHRFNNLPIEIKQSETFRKIKNYVNQFETVLHDKEAKAIYNMGLYFYGTLGNGKTTVAATIANELIDRGYSVCLISMNEAIKSTTGFQSGSHVKELIKNVDLLILDDYGKDSGSDYNVQNVYNIINDRYSVHRPLIITTNFNKEDLQDPTNIYHASNDRILEMTYGIGFMGGSKRAEQSKRKGIERTNWLNK